MKKGVEVCRFRHRTVLPIGRRQTTQAVPAMIRVLVASALCFVLLAPSFSHSAVVTEQEALTIGENFIEFMIDVRGGWGESPSPEIVAARELRKGDLFLGYHLSVSPDGHMVVPAVRVLAGLGFNTP